MIDEGISASNYNDNLQKNQKQRYGHMYEGNLNDSEVLGIDLVPTIRGFSGGIRLHF
jgi:hypothetical protein